MAFLKSEELAEAVGLSRSSVVPDSGIRSAAGPVR